MLILHVVVLILMITIIVRQFLDYKELKKQQDLNVDLLFTIYAYKLFYGDLDENSVKKARIEFQKALEKEFLNNEK